MFLKLLPALLLPSDPFVLRVSRSVLLFHLRLHLQGVGFVLLRKLLLVLTLLLRLRFEALSVLGNPFSVLPLLGEALLLILRLNALSDLKLVLTLELPLLVTVPFLLLYFFQLLAIHLSRLTFQLFMPHDFGLVPRHLLIFLHEQRLLRLTGLSLFKKLGLKLLLGQLLVQMLLVEMLHLLLVVELLRFLGFGDFVLVVDQSAPLIEDAFPGLYWQMTLFAFRVFCCGLLGETGRAFIRVLYQLALHLTHW